MPEVDDQGRITIPKHLREELGLSPGTKVEVERRDDKLVVERKRSPEVTETDAHARRHRENIRSLAERSDE